MADALIASVLGSTLGDPTTPLTPKVTAQVLVSLPTLLGLREDSGLLRGYGPIPAGLARQLADDADWQRWVFDEVTGHLQDLGKHRYRPDGQLDAFTRGRDRYCRFPGCTCAAEHCDLDHTEPFHHPNGPTCDPPDGDPPDGDPPDGGPPEGGSGQGPSDHGPTGGAGPTGLSCATADGDGGCPHLGGATAARNLAALCRPAHRAKTFGGYVTLQGPDGTLHLTTPLGRTYTTKPWDYRSAGERG
jgi:hypothetical protein